MVHRCHWPKCPVEVPPKMFACKPHWMQLPQEIRDKIWAAYRPGQEKTKTPSQAYLQAAMDALRWIRGNEQHDEAHLKWRTLKYDQ